MRHTNILLKLLGIIFLLEGLEWNSRDVFTNTNR